MSVSELFAVNTASGPVRRLRRLRASAGLRDLVREHHVRISSLVQPIFVADENQPRGEISSMPGIFRFSVDETVAEARELAALGIRAVLLFGIPDRKDAVASSAYDRNGPVQRAIRALKRELPDLVVIADLCNCEYTDHGHCGIIDAHGDVDNDRTLELLGRTALSYAEAGVDVIAPSDMMDGRVGYLRGTLDDAGYSRIPIMSYAVKFASAFYGPFREAADSTPQFGDRRTYQMDPAERARGAPRSAPRRRGRRRHDHGQARARLSRPDPRRPRSDRSADRLLQRQRRILDGQSRRAERLDRRSADGRRDADRVRARRRRHHHHLFREILRPAPPLKDVNPTMTIDRSIAAYERARRTIPGGVNSPVRAFKSVGGTPLFVREASGCRFTDLDGNSYIDYVMSWGPLILGHADPATIEAVQQAAARGTSYGAPTEAESELAELVCAMIPSVERVRFVSSGTEATMSALRLARAFTGRDKLIKFMGCYHGHGDSFLISAGSGALTLGAPDSPGITAGTIRDTIALPYNDLAAVRAAFEAEPNAIAAVIVEPYVGNMGLVLPKPGYLQGLRALTSEFGALLIFDEVMTGFRVAPGGVQEREGITPDLTTLGKIIGGGLPGRRVRRPSRDHGADLARAAPSIKPGRSRGIRSRWRPGSRRCARSASQASTSGSRRSAPAIGRPRRRLQRSAGSRTRARTAARWSASISPPSPSSI